MPKPKEGIYQRNGIWGIRYTLPAGPDGKRRQKRESLGRGPRDGPQPGEKDAEERLRDRLHELDHNIIADAGTLTVAQYFARWLLLGQPDRSPTTHERYEQLIRLHIVPLIGHVRLGKLRPLQILGCLSNARNSGLAPKTVKHIHTLIHCGLTRAVKWQVLSVNPCAAVDSPRVPKPKIRTASEEDIANLLVAIEGSYYRIPILIAIATGMRRGEVCGLKWSDLQPDARTLQVQRSLIQTAAGVIEKPTKTDTARTILLPQQVVDDLLRHQVDQGHNPDGWICLNAIGGRLAPKSLDRAYRALRRGVGVDVTLHGLRHTQATNLILAGVPVKIVADRLGHSTVTVTQDIYAHVLPQHQETAVQVVEKMLESKPKIRIVQA
jgi:integrase